MTADKGVPQVLLFLAEGFEDLEAVSVLDVCGWTEYREYIPKVRVVTTGIRPEVKGRFGLQIRPDLLLKDVRPGDFAALAIPGGFFGAANRRNETATKWDERSLWHLDENMSFSTLTTNARMLWEIDSICETAMPFYLRRSCVTC